MYNYKFETCEPLLNAEQLEKGTFLWIWKPTKLPPHLGVSHNGLYYSLLYERKQVALSLESQLEIIDRKKLSMIWQEINLKTLEFDQIFESFTSCSVDHCSCIQPILDGLQIHKKGGVLFDLLQELDNRKATGRVYQRNIHENFKGIKKYNRREVEMYLFKLQA